jgi:class 3 adenylate cyclase
MQFPNATVMFADIAGFTAWSSVREPSQVFTLLETIYRAFDHIAKKRKVFKVETVGDCYVAVTGLPEPRADHAVAMCKFSRDCLDKFNELVKDLEIKLGPDTGDLALRTGLHSGPVTAGVLRGDKSRFQLFGDTVNTAAKIESAGMKSRVHISVEVAKLLQEHGKNTWCVKREDAAVAKSGKLDIETYWLVVGENGYLGPEAKSNAPAKVDVIAGGNRKFGDTTLADLEASIDPKMLRLVAWNVEIMKKLLQQIIAKRNAALNKKATAEELAAKEKLISRRTNCLDEVVEIIHLPKFDAQAYKHQENPNKIVIPANVVEQLRLFVTTVAAMYRDNPFHNFEHASHVTMVRKILALVESSSWKNSFSMIVNLTHAFYLSFDQYSLSINCSPVSSRRMIFSSKMMVPRTLLPVCMTTHMELLRIL